MRKTTNSRPGNKIGIALRAAFSGVALLSLADCSVTGGKYGGQALDAVSLHDGANVYRTGGIFMNGAARLITWAVTDFAREAKGIADRHGSPSP